MACDRSPGEGEGRGGARYDLPFIRTYVKDMPTCRVFLRVGMLLSDRVISP